MHSEWKKWRDHLTGLFSLAIASLEKWGLKPYGRILRHQMTFLGGKKLPPLRCTFPCYSTHKDISNGTRSAPFRVSMQKLCHSEVELPIVTPIVLEDVVSTPIIHGK